MRKSEPKKVKFTVIKTKGKTTPLLDCIAEAEAKSLSERIDIGNKSKTERLLRDFHRDTGSKLIVGEAIHGKLVEYGISTAHVEITKMLPTNSTNPILVKCFFCKRMINPERHDRCPKRWVPKIHFRGAGWARKSGEFDDFDD